VNDALELYVNSPAFDIECAVLSKGIGTVPLSDGGNSDYSSDYRSLWEKDSSSSISSVKSSRYDVSKLECYGWSAVVCDVHVMGYVADDSSLRQAIRLN
jgi:hypothetical protein